MRKVVKFRGKDIKTGEWLYGDLVHSADGEHIAILVNDRNSYNECEVTPNTVGQYTGIKDRNDKEIYEGDLIEYCSCVDSFGAVWQTVRIEYRTKEGGYVGINRYRRTHDGREIVQNIVRCLNKCIVCGNIHDNQNCRKEARDENQH